MGTTPAPPPSATVVQPSPSVDVGRRVVGLESRLVGPHPGLQEPGLLVAVGHLGVHDPAAGREPLHLPGTDHPGADRRGVPQRRR